MELKPIPEPDDDFDVDFLKVIEEFGWGIIQVAPDADEPGYVPPFAYTVGLFRNFGHPELIIFGLRLEVMKAMLNNCGFGVRNGILYVNGWEEEDILDDYPVTFRTVPESQYAEHVGYAAWFNQTREFPVLQVIYPDLEGRWPWTEGVHPGFVEQQPVLADREHNH